MKRYLGLESKALEDALGNVLNVTVCDRGGGGVSFAAK